MDANRMQAQGGAQQIRGGLTEMQGRGDRMLGRLRWNLGGMLGRFQGMPNGGLLNGVLAFGAVALLMSMVLMPSFRQGVVDGVTSRTPWGRHTSMLDRFVNWFEDLLP